MELGRKTKTLGLGASSICRKVIGPASVSFWWKSKTMPSGYGDLSFLVDGEQKPIYSSSNWTHHLYYLPDNKTYKIEWRYTQGNAKMEFGVGWIDDVDIQPVLSNLLTSLDCIIDAPDVAIIGSTYIASTHGKDNVDYNWSIDGGLILGNANNKSIIWKAGPSQFAAVELEVSRPKCCSATCSKNITVMPENWLYKNKTISQLFRLIRPPNNNITYVSKNHDYFNHIYLTINEAINNVTSGGRVMIADGIYNERVFIYKPISLIGNDINNTIIKDVIYVSSDNVEILNLTIQSKMNGIWVRGENCSLTNIIVQDCSDYGIVFDQCSESKIKNCYLRNIGDTGVYLYLSNNCIVQNSILFNISRFGVALVDSCHNVIDNNIFTSLKSGVKLFEDSGDNNITKTNKFNSIKPNPSCEVFISECSKPVKCGNNDIYNKIKEC